MNIDNAFKLLEDFNSLPKRRIEPTFLEVCRYPKRRFEEICSRILGFYFNPCKEHDLKDLFLNSFFELINRRDIKFQDEQIKIVSEDNADGKRIDLVIFSPDFVIGIENKITASLYNPLDVYKERLKDYHIDKKIMIVLSVEKITKKEEVGLIERNGFKAITYSDFFEVIKRNIGKYISECNQKYLIQLYDFINTLENMNTNNPIDKKRTDFYFNNAANIDELIIDYNNYKERILNMQKERITELREKISQITGKEWWAWQGWDLGYNSFNPNRPKIGIESSFEATKDNPLGKFKIYITTWNLKDWMPYENLLSSRYPGKFIDRQDRVYLHMDVIENDNEDLIMSKLKEYFYFLEEITK